jgi:hypothetical protein
MALSDDLTKLATRTKEAEDRAASAREKAKADVETDREAARAAGEEQAQALRESAEEKKGDISDSWHGVQQSWNERIAKVRADIKARKVEHDVHKAQRRADRAEDDATFAIDFAYSTVVEAEYAVLDATLARKEAEDLAAESTPTSA